MAEASRHFGRAGSPYRNWSPIVHATLLRNKGDLRAALDDLQLVRGEGLRPNYHHLRGRMDWTRGVTLYELGRIDLGRTHLRSAVAEFSESGETENLAAVQTILA